MNVLIIGSGGREHALAWKVAQSKQVTKIYIAPGNAGTATEPKCENVPIGAEDCAGLLHFAKECNIALTIVGPEAPLVAGIVDQFNQAGLHCFGPSAKAAQLEGSKTFSKNILSKYNIPTANYQSFTDLADALLYLETQSYPLVIKADGLAAGKGVVIASTKADATDAVTTMLKDNRFGEASSRVVIEAFLEGEEVSYIALVDNNHIIPLATSQDHKARYENDQGPNTGGMGAFSPAPRVDECLDQRIMETVIQPVVKALASEGIPYQGFLYAGLMISADNTPYVLEFNCRLGDPETQPIMMRLESDLIELCLAGCRNQLASTTVSWKSEAALGVVLVADGYPEQYRTGDAIDGLDNQLPAHSKVFHAGTIKQKNKILTNGGRVLCVTSLGKDLKQAQQHAYHDVSCLHFSGLSYRRDIGNKVIES